MIDQVMEDTNVFVYYSLRKEISDDRRLQHFLEFIQSVLVVEKQILSKFNAK